MTFSITSDVHIKRDRDGVVCKIHHPRQAYAAEDVAALGVADTAGREMTPRALADEYLREILPVYELDQGMADSLAAAAVEGEVTDERSRIRFVEEKVLRNQALVSYTQTAIGLPVWQSGLTVKMAGHPYRVVSSQSTVQPEIEVNPPEPDAPYLPESLDAAALAKLLAVEGGSQPTVHRTRLWVYRYDQDDRGNAVGDAGPSNETEAHVAGPTLPVPDLPDDLEPGRYYVAVQVHFSLDVPDWEEVNWGAFIEPESGAVLRLDSFVGCVDALVYLRDPLTKTGNTSILPTSSAAVLNTLRDDVTLEGLETPAGPADEQELRGDLVHVHNFRSPNIQPPTEPQGSDFDYPVPTDNFAAVNAYFHCDRLFRLVEEMGFNLAGYFDGTNFPVRVDHRVAFDGNPLSVNAQAPGNFLGNGSDGFRFAMVAQNTSVGMAVEWRVILHEFGHTILWDHLNSPNFRFAHSPGDSLAAILNDPETRLQGSDRFFTFPWTPIRRRHDRRPEDGWGWGGTFDDSFPVGHPLSGDRAGYRREQILSSTLFRYYRAIGGDHTDPAIRRSAARYVTFLIFSAVSVLTAVAPPSDAEDFADELMDADLAAGQFEVLAGGATHKVVRWAFERQGLYQPPGAPSPTVQPGAPPAVDVYLDDGRDGAYDPRPHFVFNTGDIWNRRAADGDLAHQPPASGQANFLYIRARNRGSDPANNVTAEVFSSRDPAPRLWPDQWQILGDPVVNAGAPIPGGGEAVLGPLEWSPGDQGPITLLASVSADGDPSNTSTVSGSIVAARLTHYDNNIAGRTMRVEPEDGGPDGEDSKISLEARPLLAIPDADPAGVVHVLDVADSGVLRSLRVAVTIRHTWRGDLRVSLISPGGITVVLYEGDGDPSDDLVDTFSSDTMDALAALHGADPQGGWALRVVDRVGQDVGFLEKWSLEIELEAP